MVTSNFSISEDLILTEQHSGMQLEMVTDQEPAEDLVWIEGWFDLPNGNCVVQMFIVLETGNPTYQLVNEVIVFWAREVLDGGGIFRAAAADKFMDSAGREYAIGKCRF